MRWKLLAKMIDNCHRSFLYPYILWNYLRNYLRIFPWQKSAYFCYYPFKYHIFNFFSITFFFLSPFSIFDQFYFLSLPLRFVWDQFSFLLLPFYLIIISSYFSFLFHRVGIGPNHFTTSKERSRDTSWWSAADSERNYWNSFSGKIDEILFVESDVLTNCVRDRPCASCLERILLRSMIEV